MKKKLEVKKSDVSVPLKIWYVHEMEKGPLKLAATLLNNKYVCTSHENLKNVRRKYLFWKRFFPAFPKYP